MLTSFYHLLIILVTQLIGYQFFLEEYFMDRTNQQTLTVNKKNKSANTRMLILAGVGTGIGYLLATGLSSLIVNAICRAEYQTIDYNTDYFAFSQMVNGLGTIVTFIIRAVILLIFAAFSCKIANERLGFFACSISGQAIGEIVGKMIITIIAAVYYAKGSVLSNITYANITMGLQVVNAAFAALIAVALLAFVSSRKQAPDSPVCTESRAQGEASSDSDDEGPLS